MFKRPLRLLIHIFALGLVLQNCMEVRNNPLDPSAANFINPSVPKFVKGIGGYGSAPGQFLGPITQVFESSFDGSIWVTARIGSYGLPAYTRFDSNGENPTQFPNIDILNQSSAYDNSIYIFSNTTSGNLVFFGLANSNFPVYTNVVFLQEVSATAGTNISLKFLSTNFPSLSYAQFQAPDKIWGVHSSIIKCYSTNGTVIRNVGSLGTGDGQFNQLQSSPSLILLLAPNYLIARKDSSANQVFDLLGNFLFSIPWGNNYAPSYGEYQQNILKFSTPAFLSPLGYYSAPVVPIHPSTGRPNGFGWGGSNENIGNASKIIVGNRNSIFLIYSQTSDSSASYFLSIYR